MKTRGMLLGFHAAQRARVDRHGLVGRPFQFDEMHQEGITAAQAARMRSHGGRERAGRSDARGFVGRPFPLGAETANGAPRAAGRDAAQPTTIPRNADVPRSFDARGEGRGLIRAGVVAMAFALGHATSGDAWLFLGVAAAYLAGLLHATGALVAGVRWRRG